MENSIDEDIVMSDLTASRLGYQSWSVQTQVDDQPSESMKLEVDQHMTPYMAKTAKPQPILDSEWSQVERLVRHLYIEKDQSLKAVQRYLSEKHGLIVTYGALYNVPHPPK
jgi:Clr5 domain